MANTKSNIKPLDKLRGEFWVRRCMQVAGVRSMAALDTLQDEVPTKDLWSKYKGGFARPLMATVLLLDKRFEGTARIWIDGPHRLPMWAVLGGDLKACSDFLKDYLYEHAENSSFFSAPKLSVRTFSVEAMVFMLIRINLPEFNDLALSYYENGQIPPWDIEQEFGGIEFAISEKHFGSVIVPTAETNLLQDWCKILYAELDARGRSRYDPGSAKTPLILRYDSLLAFIAAIFLCRNSKNKVLNKTADYLWTGVETAIARQFGREEIIAIVAP